MVDGEQFIHIVCAGRLQKADKECLATVHAAIGQSNSMHGGETTVDILIAVTPFVLKHIKDIVGQLTSNRRKIKIKAPDFEISDIDRKLAKEISEKLVERLKVDGAEIGEKVGPADRPRKQSLVNRSKKATRTDRPKKRNRTDRPKT